jgi:dTDP-4-dehydrorhamnose 3,5-epimerase
MQFIPSDLDGICLVQSEPRYDERGSFARWWCAQELAAAGLVATCSQVSMVHTLLAGTIRGLHFQAAPHWETKIIRCIRGAAFVVCVDVRADSPNHCRWTGVEMYPDSQCALYVPEGFVQGYQTLADDTELLYQMSTPYEPSAARGYRYDDPAFSISWPLAPRCISARDLSWSSYNHDQ